MSEYEKRSYRLEERCPNKASSDENGFVVLSLVHTVTNVFVDLLNKSPDVIMHGELFHELEAEVLNTSFLRPWNLYSRDESPSDFLEHIFSHTGKKVGFMSRPEHWDHREDVFMELVNDKAVKKIVLTGDPSRSFAAHRKQLEDDELSLQTTDYSAPAIQRFIDNIKRAEIRYRDILDSSHTLWLSLDYFYSNLEDLSSQVLEFLGVSSVQAHSAMSDVEELAKREMSFHPLQFIMEHTEDEELEMIKFAFGLYFTSEELSTLTSEENQLEPFSRADGHLEWALLIPIKSDCSPSAEPYYHWKRLWDFLDSLQKSIPDESQSRVTIYFGVDSEDGYLMKNLTAKLVEWTGVVGLRCLQVLVNEENGHVCKIWNKLALEAHRDGRDLFVLLGDDISFHSDNWMSSIEHHFEEIALRTGLGYGVGCVAFNDLTFPGFPTFPVLHRSHIDVFESLFSRRFINQDADPYLFELYDRLGASVIDTCAKIRNNVGGHSKARYEKRRIRFKNTILSQGLKQLKTYFGEFSVLPSIDVVIPTYRMNVQSLDNILSLRVRRPCRVKFWIVVDNPNETVELSKICEKYDGKSVHGNYHTEVLVHPTNLGASAARNTGMMRSVADWVVLLDDDVKPEEDILERYLSATLRYPEADAFAGVTKFPPAVTWWQRALKVSGVLTFYKIAELSNSVHVPWSVTANLCVKGRTNDEILFRRDYPKTGGGEDVDFCFRLKQNGKGIVGVPSAVVQHPWFGKNGFDGIRHVMKWVTGDSRLVELFPGHTFYVFPGWTEFILLIALPGVYLGVFMKVVMYILCLEMGFKCHAFYAQALSEDVRKEDKTVAGIVFGCFILMGQEGIRTVCHMKRKCWWALCRRLDWFDGMDMGGVWVIQKQHALKFLVYCLVVVYVGRV